MTDIAEREGAGMWMQNPGGRKRTWIRRYEKDGGVVELKVIEMERRIMASEADPTGFDPHEDEDCVVDEAEFVVDVSVGDQVLTRAVTLKLLGRTTPEDACSFAPSIARQWFTQAWVVMAPDI